VLRSYYDTYTKRRKIYEQNLEKEANQILAKAEIIGSSNAMDEALAIVNKADKELISADLRQKIVDYCEALFQSIGMQTSVKKYNASGAERGAILDFVDYPLNNPLNPQQSYQQKPSMHCV
jgi:sugar-specific transcriptional regulator TrmB